MMKKPSERKKGTPEGSFLEFDAGAIFGPLLPRITVFGPTDGVFALINGDFQSTNGNCQSKNEVVQGKVATFIPDRANFIPDPANFMGWDSGIVGDSVEMRLGLGV